MKLDVHTLALVMSVTSFLQLIALTVLYRMNMPHKGLGFWITGTATWSLAFACNYLRDAPGIGLFAIVANNTLFVAGLSFIYIGVLRFFNKREQSGWIITYCAVVTLIAFYFTFIENNLAVRRVNFSFGNAIMTLLIARALFAHRISSVASSTYFLTLIFLTFGVFFILRGLTPFVTDSVGTLFAPSMNQSATYLGVLIVTTLWTMGFIIMISQRMAFENREAKEAAERALDNERHMLLEQRQFLGMVSHEFRTPLAVIDSAATNLMAVPLTDQNDLDQRAEQIRRATRSLTQLIDNCLTSERIEHGGFEVMRQETEVLPLIQESAHLVNFSLRHALQIESQEAPETWLLDPTLIKIALSNLIDNAVKYSYGGTVTVTARKQGDSLCLGVMNKGCDISVEESENLFQKFVRGDAARRGKSIRGSGLGLFISQRIAQAHGGEVSLRSGEMGVTIFEMKIPWDRQSFQADSRYSPA